MFTAILGKPCQHDSFGRYCSKCGHERVPARLTFKSLLEEFVAGWLQKGFRQTVLGLLIAPGQQLRRYLTSDRTLLVKPISYLVVIVAFHYFILSLTTGGKLAISAAGLAVDGAPEDEAAMTEAMVWLSKHGFEFSLLQAFIAALLLRFVFYRKRHVSLAEFTIFMTFVLAQSLLIKVLLNVAWLPTDGLAPGWLVLGIGMIFNIWAVVSFMAARNVWGVLRAVLWQISSLLCTFALVVTLLVVWDLNRAEIKQAVSELSQPITQAASFGPR